MENSIGKKELNKHLNQFGNELLRTINRYEEEAIYNMNAKYLDEMMKDQRYTNYISESPKEPQINHHINTNEMDTILKCTHLTQGEGVQVVTLSNRNMRPIGSSTAFTNDPNYQSSGMGKPLEKRDPVVDVTLEITKDAKGYDKYMQGRYYLFVNCEIPTEIRNPDGCNEIRR